MLKMTESLKRSTLKKLRVGNSKVIEFGVGGSKSSLNQKIV